MPGPDPATMEAALSAIELAAATDFADRPDPAFLKMAQWMRSMAYEGLHGTLKQVQSMRAEVFKEESDGK